MRHTARAHHRQNEGARLHSEEAFARYARALPSQPKHPDAESIARATMRRHCAGLRGARTLSGAEVLEALRAPPDTPGEAAAAVRWMLGSISVSECIRLVHRCGIAHEALARHVRARPRRRPALVRYLNQYAIPDSEPRPEIQVA